MSVPFHEIRLDPLISWGSEIGPTYKTRVSDVPNGAETTSGLWQNGRLRMTISKETLDDSTRFILESFFRARKGMRFAFRVRYWNKFKVVDEPLPLLTGTTAQLQFVYPDAINPETEIVKKPVLAADVNNTSTAMLYAPDITLKRDGTAFPTSGGANWTIDRTTGIITFAASQTGHTILWSGSFDFPMRFETDSQMIKRNFMNDHDWGSFNLIQVKL